MLHLGYFWILGCSCFLQICLIFALLVKTPRFIFVLGYWRSFGYFIFLGGATLYLYIVKFLCIYSWCWTPCGFLVCWLLRILNFLSKILGSADVLVNHMHWKMFLLITCIGNDQFWLDLCDYVDFSCKELADFWLIGITYMIVVDVLIVLTTNTKLFKFVSFRVGSYSLVSYLFPGIGKKICFCFCSSFC